jgi:TolA-binding protein
MRYLMVGLFAMTTLGCLKTRSEVKDTETRQNMQQQVVTLQKNTADSTNRFSELEEEVRLINGRTEVLENRLAVRGQETDKEKKSLTDQNADLQRKFSLLQESMVKMEQQVGQLSTEVAALQAQVAAHSSAPAASPASKKTSYDIAQELFNEKEWKKAASAFDKYRQDSPKGKNFADATYKIGVCFQELGMKDEARTFYEEVISKHAGTEEARRAKVRLKGLRR